MLLITFIKRQIRKSPLHFKRAFLFPSPIQQALATPAGFFHALLTFPEIGDIFRTSELGFLGLSGGWWHDSERKRGWKSKFLVAVF
jgi:hypothetical protein